MATIYGYRQQVEERLSEEFRRGGGLVGGELDGYRVELGTTDEGEYEGVNLGLNLVDGLLEYVEKDSPWAVDDSPLSDSQKNEMDAWLAPRLHAAMRIPRRLAGDKRFWAWVAIERANSYVVRRWTSRAQEPVRPWRYTGDLLRNTISRLWWGAEMTRNGSDYSHVPLVFRRTRTAQWALELLYSQYRPAAIAFTRIAEAGEPLSDDEMNGLSKRINVLLSLNSLESRGAYQGRQDEPGPEWYRRLPSLEELLSRELPTGPETETVPEPVIQSLEGWFRDLVEGGPLP
jgi:hypothetical protein